MTAAPDPDLDCPDDSLSCFEEAAKANRDGIRALRDRVRQPGCTADDLLEELKRSLRLSTRQIKQHLDLRFGAQSQVFVSILRFKNGAGSSPSQFQVMECSVGAWRPAEQPMSDAPNLLRLWYRQGANGSEETPFDDPEAEDHGETDWTSIASGSPDRMLGRTFEHGVLVAMRVGLAPQAPNGRQAPDVPGLLSFTSRRELRGEELLQWLHIARTFTLIVTDLFVALEMSLEILAKTDRLTVERSNLEEVAAALAAAEAETNMLRSQLAQKPRGNRLFRFVMSPFDERQSRRESDDEQS